MKFVRILEKATLAAVEGIGRLRCWKRTVLIERKGSALSERVWRKELGGLVGSLL